MRNKKKTKKSHDKILLLGNTERECKQKIRLIIPGIIEYNKNKRHFKRDRENQYNDLLDKVS